MKKPKMLDKILDEVKKKKLPIPGSLDLPGAGERTWTFTGVNPLDPKSQEHMFSSIFTTYTSTETL